MAGSMAATEPTEQGGLPHQILAELDTKLKKDLRLLLAP